MGMDEAREFMHKHTHFASMMVRLGEADCLLSGVTQYFPESIRPPLKILGPKEAGGRVAAAHIVVLKREVYFLADTSVTIEPSAEDLAEIAVLTADLARSFQITPRVAMLSFSR